MTASTRPPVHRAAYPLIVDHSIRYNDTDRQGHVNHAAFATYFEFVRTQFFHAVAPDMMAEGSLLALVRIEIDYLSELFFPGELGLAMGVAHIGSSSARFAQAVFSGDACAAVGVTILVHLDATTRRPQPWTEAQRARLETFRMRA